MTIYLRKIPTCSSESGGKSPTLYIKRTFLTLILLCASSSCASTGVFGQEAQDEAPAIENEEYDENLVRELREVQEQYPLLARRLGLVHVLGVRLHLLCTGGVDPGCHQSVQQNCIDSGPGRPDYQHCLDLANRVCCRQAVFTQ